MTNVVWAVIRDYKYTSFAEFNAALGQFGIVADRGKEDTMMYAKMGLVYSLIDVEGRRVGIPFKASALSGRPLLDIVEQKFQKSKEIRKTYRQSIQQRIDSVLKRYTTLTKHTFDRELLAGKIGTVYWTNAEGRCYGITFVDHRTKCVFNGSDLGKAYSAGELTAQFSSMDQPKTYLQQPSKASSFQQQKVGSTNITKSEDSNFLDIALERQPSEPLAQGLDKKRKRRKQQQTLNR